MLDHLAAKGNTTRTPIEDVVRARLFAGDRVALEDVPREYVVTERLPTDRSLSLPDVVALHAATNPSTTYRAEARGQRWLVLADQVPGPTGRQPAMLPLDQPILLPEGSVEQPLCAGLEIFVGALAAAIGEPVMLVCDREGTVRLPEGRVVARDALIEALDAVDPRLVWTMGGIADHRFLRIDKPNPWVVPPNARPGTAIPIPPEYRRPSTGVPAVAAVNAPGVSMRAFADHTEFLLWGPDGEILRRVVDPRRAGEIPPDEQRRIEEELARP